MAFRLIRNARTYNTVGVPAEFAHVAETNPLLIQQHVATLWSLAHAIISRRSFSADSRLVSSRN